MGLWLARGSAMCGSEQVHGCGSERDASRAGLQKCSMCLGCSAILAGAGEIGDGKRRKYFGWLGFAFFYLYMAFWLGFHGPRMNRQVVTCDPCEWLCER